MDATTGTDPATRSFRAALGLREIVAIIESGVACDPATVLAEVYRTACETAAGQPEIHRQTCPNQVHRDWWAETPGLDCPSCRIVELEARLAWLRSVTS